MGIIAYVIAAFGGLSLIMGVLDVADIFSDSGLAVGYTFWFLLSIALFLAAITIILGRRRTPGA
jgi:hypothetical protein